MNIANKYQILHEIGRGGMGIIYKAQDIRLGRTVAIKELILPSTLKIEDRDILIQRFHREAQAAATLNHPNIITIYDICVYDNKHYIVMEYVEGNTLKNYIQQKIKLEFDKLIDIFIQVCEGLEHAHSKGIIHRDIKPDNIIVTNTGIVKITDFGVARIQHNMSVTTDGTMIGTLDYMAPEQLSQPHSVDKRADIFSLGAVLYEIFTQTPPFTADSIGTQVLKILTQNPTPPSLLNSDISSSLEQIILKALNKDPDLRFQSAKEFSIELQNLKNKENQSNLGESSSEYFYKEYSLAKSHTTIEIEFYKSIGKKGMKKGEFQEPKTFCVSNFGVIYVIDGGNQSLQVFDKLGEWQYFIPLNQGNIICKNPVSVSTDNKNKIYILDAIDCKVKIIDTYGTFLKEFGEKGQGRLHFNAPSFLIINHSAIYVADTGNSRIQVIDLNGQVINIFKVSSKLGELKNLISIAVDEQGKIYCLDSTLSKVLVIDKNGIARAYFGNKGFNKGEFSLPKGITVDKNNNIYIADTLNNRIQIFNSKGEFITSFGHKGNKEGEFISPEAIFINQDNLLYVLDKGNCRIQIFKIINN